LYVGALSPRARQIVTRSARKRRGVIREKSGDVWKRRGSLILGIAVKAKETLHGAAWYGYFGDEDIIESV